MIEKMKAPVLIVLLVLCVLPILLAVPTTTEATNGGPLIIVKLHTNATALGPCHIPISNLNGQVTNITGTSYANIKIIFNITWIQVSAYVISPLNFKLIVTQRNQVVANSTLSNQVEEPTNLITNFPLFQNIPVVFVASFAPVCVTPGSVARIVYQDSNTAVVFDLP